MTEVRRTSVFGAPRTVRPGGSIFPPAGSICRSGAEIFAVSPGLYVGGVPISS